MVKTDKLADAYVGNVSCIGYVNGNGLYISSWDGKRECSIGVGASRKLRIL
jgi:hypothetical protein